MSSWLRRTFSFVVTSALLSFGWPSAAPACDEPRPPRCLAPSGGADDTALLQGALDRCSGARRPCTVSLCAGVFPTGILRVRDFRGTLRGAGPEKTVLRALPDLPTSRVTPDFYREDPFSPAADPWPFLVQFVEGRARVLDLAIEVPDPPEGSKVTTGWFQFDFPFSSLRGGLLFTGRETVSFAARHVRVEGAAYSAGGDFQPRTASIGASCEGLLFDPDPPAGYSSDYPVFPFEGACSITDSSFRGVLRGTVLWELAGAKVLLAGNRYEGSKAVEILDADRSHVAVLGNDWDVSVRGLQVQQNVDGAPSGHSAIAVSGNRGRVVPSYLGDGLSFVDPFDPTYEPGGTALRVTGNDWTIGDASLPAVAGLEIVGAARLRVRDNLLGGRVLNGLTVDGTTGCRLSRNAFDWELVGAGPDVPLPPDLRLGPETSGCLAVVGPDDTVVDEGRDNRVVRK